MADFVKGLFGAQKPVQAPVAGDDGMLILSTLRLHVYPISVYGPKHTSWDVRASQVVFIDNRCCIKETGGTESQT